MKKIKPISGFPEWLPAQRIVEQHFLALIREKFELFGFAPIETRAVESLDQLTNQGETEKEIYVLRRLHAEEGDGNTNMGLHFDLTVPFARYVTQNRADLHFPMKRYQIQKVWRGERPQEGRYREFYQADIDVIADGVLPIHFDAEMPLLLHEITSALPMPPIQILINNRKVMEGFYRGIGIEDIHGVLRIVDKLEKIGPEGVETALVDQLGLTTEIAQKCLALSEIRSEDSSFAQKVRELGVEHPLLDEGLEELTYVMDFLSSLPSGSVMADLRIARGLDYYTGTVYEGIMQGFENLGSVCSGGRYDNLISEGRGQYPGVGVSLGVTRILGSLFASGALQATRSTPTSVLIALPSDEQRPGAEDVARQLRARGICTEVYHLPQKYGKQIRYAERKGIPFVWFPEAEGSGVHEVRDIRTGDQEQADAGSWSPPDDDLHVRIVFAPASTE